MHITTHFLACHTIYT